MYNILVLGAGKIGSLIACMLNESHNYKVHLADNSFKGEDVQALLNDNSNITTVALDVVDEESLIKYINSQSVSILISCLPGYLNLHVANAAKSTSSHYFDISEDTETTATIKKIAANADSVFVPQCGLAPGFVSILANHLIQKFDECHNVRLRVGALPQQATHPMQFALICSTEGVLNEYGNTCYGIHENKLTSFAPLTGKELVTIDGDDYEAFHTSGGVGGLGEMYEGLLHSLNFKTIRYPGHCEKINFLMNDLQLKKDRISLQNILEGAIPSTDEDLVIVHVSADGMIDGDTKELNITKTLYPQKLFGRNWSALQLSTAAGVCGVVDLVLENQNKQSGVFYQDSLCFEQFIENRYGKHYA